MDKLSDTQSKGVNLTIRIAILLFILALIIMGIVLLAICGPLVETNEQEIDYTHCEMVVFNKNNAITCAEYKEKNLDTCICLQPFNLAINLVGDVVLYYTLDEFDQSKYAKSRDDEQLSGKLSTKVSPDCDPFNYTSDGKPIAPCGALADSMFNDTYILRGSNTLAIKSLDHGMLKNKGIYRNPPGNESLEVLFQNYSKPINWKHNVWNLSTIRSSNGFENERFIGWMETNLKRKPALRLDMSDYTGNLSGQFSFKIGYNYPPRVYSGPRKLILVSTHMTERSTGKYVFGILFLIFGIASLVAAIIVVVWRIRENRWQWY